MSKPLKFKINVWGQKKVNEHTLVEKRIKWITKVLDICYIFKYRVIENRMINEFKSSLNSDKLKKKNS